MLGVGGWLCLTLDREDLAGAGVARGLVATPGVCVIERRRIAGWRETSEEDREIAAFCGCTNMEARLLAIMCGLESAKDIDV